jgi:hypothetical protein
LTEDRPAANVALMGIASVVLGVLAMISMVAGFFLTIVPVLGTVLGCGSPLLCIVGVVLGGVALSHAKRDGMPTGLPTAGIVVNAIVFFPSAIVALTCGLCNACASASMIEGGNPPTWTRTDAGVQMTWGTRPPNGFAPSGPTPGAPLPPSQPPQPPGEAAPNPPSAPRPEGAPPPAFPPPPLEPSAPTP